MAWKKVHQDALKHKDDMESLKNININQSSAIQNKVNRIITDKDYSIATYSHYIKVNNEMTRKHINSLETNIYQRTSNSDIQDMQLS